MTNTPNFGKAGGYCSAGFPALAPQPETAAAPEVVPPQAEDALPQFSMISGGAGVGKTHQAKKFAEDQGCELVASTGIAAMNLGEGVVTINSLLGYFDTDSLRDLWTTGRLTAKLGRLYRSGMRRIVLDEVSMFSGSQLSVLCQAIDELAASASQIRIGLTLVGDFAQLPPVKDTYAFEADEFERFRPNITKLTKVWRQEDQDFVAALQAVRRGDRDHALDFFGPKLERTLLQDYAGTTILAKNDEVDRYNTMRHAMVRGEMGAWTSSRWGKERGEWKLIPATLQAKVGALVMVLANKKELDDLGEPAGNYEYVNGDLGEVEAVDEGVCHVKLHRGKVVEVGMITRENLVPCDSARRKELKWTAGWANLRQAKGREDRAPEWEALGGVTYMPLRLAFATTCHKSQGLTLDQVQLSLASHFWEENGGMVYVALSRARTAEGLRIVASKELMAKRICTNPKIKEWI